MQIFIRPHLLISIVFEYNNEKELLESCYRNSLELAVSLGCKSVNFPLISSGIYGYPKEEAFCVAADTIKDFLGEHELDVMIVLFDDESFSVGERLFREKYAE